MNDDEMGEVIQLQGDQRKDVQEFLVDKKEGLELDAKTIKVRSVLLSTFPPFARSCVRPASNLAWYLADTISRGGTNREMEELNPLLPSRELLQHSSHFHFLVTLRALHLLYGSISFLFAGASPFFRDL